MGRKRGRTAILAVLVVTSTLLLTGCTEMLRKGQEAVVVTVSASEAASQATGSPERIRIMTYNIHHAESTDGVTTPLRIAETLRRYRPDVVVMNEVDVNWSRSGFLDQAHRIAEAAAYPYYAFAPSLSRPAGLHGLAHYGNAVLSRFPITLAERHLLPGSLWSERRSVLSVALDIKGTSLQVMGTHLGLEADNRMAQVKSIIGLVDTTEPPVVVAGDFNTTPTSAEVKALTTRLTDTYRGSEDTSPNSGAFTFPFPTPSARIDYIFTSNDLAGRVLDHRVAHVEGSDHLPVLVDIDWTKPQGPRRVSDAEGQHQSDRNSSPS